MATEKFSIDDLMTLLVTKVGLPVDARTDNALATFEEVGLDSLAFLQLQTELQSRYSFELPSDDFRAYSLGEITAYVNEHLVREGVA
jgi:minimal PKS acyl carrier protein